MKKTGRRRKEFVSVTKKTERHPAELAKVYLHRLIISGLVIFAGLLVALVPAFVPSLNSFFVLGVMLGMPTALFGIVAFAMFWILRKRLEKKTSS